MPITEFYNRGKQKNSGDNRLYFGAETGFTPNWILLHDHSLGEPVYTDVAPVTAMHRLHRGRKITYRRVLQPGSFSGVDYELNLADGYETTAPQLERAAGRPCPYEMIIHDPCECSFARLRNVMFDDFRRRGTPIDAARDSTSAPLQWFTTLRGTEVRYPLLKGMVRNADAGMAVYGIDFQLDTDCPDCDPLSHQRGGWVGGEIGAPYDGDAAYTDDLFASGTAPASFLPVGQIATSLHYDGSRWFVTSSDDLDAGTATVGYIFVSDDDMATWTQVYTFTEGLYDLVWGQSYVWAVGGAGHVVYSPNGNPNSFSVLTNTVLATADFARIAFDQRTGNLYVVGDIAGDGVVAVIEDGVIADITADVGTLTGIELYAVKVLSSLPWDAYSHVAVAGEGGFYAENADVGNPNESWVPVTLPTTDDVRAIEGDSLFTVLGAGTDAISRSVCTDFDFKIRNDLEGKITNDIQVGTTGLADEGVQYVAFGTSDGTDTGEIVILMPANIELN